MRLAAVFDERESLALGERGERRHVCGLAIQMHRQQRGRAIGNRPLRSAWIQRQSFRIDIGEDRTSARHDDRDGRVRGGEWSRDDLVAGADAERAKNQRDRVGAVADADGVRRAGCGGELPLERLDLGPQHEPCAVDHARDGLADRVRLFREVEIVEGNSNAHATVDGVDAGSSRYSPACAR